MLGTVINEIQRVHLMTFRDFPIKSLARFIMMGEGKGTAGKCSCCSMNGANFSAINSKRRNFPLQTKVNEGNFPNSVTLSSSAELSLGLWRRQTPDNNVIQ